MKKGEIYEGVIEKVDFPNKGIVMVDEQKVTVKNGMPGQKVRFMINKKRSGRAEGRLLEVLEKSPLETRNPVCSIFPECGGCMYQTMSYENQLAMKERQVRDLLEGALNGADYQWEGIHGSPIEFRYRNKMEFPSVMHTKTVLSHLVCTRKAAPTTCLLQMTVSLFTKI